MDKKINGLELFYQTLCRGHKAKLETRQYGFRFIEELKRDGAVLDYVQLDNKLVHKYRLLNLSAQQIRQLLRGHVNQEYNVCLYFDPMQNDIFCINLDNNFKTNNTEIIPEMELAVKYLCEHFGEYGMEPLCIKSGRGYHVWCRLQAPVETQLLYPFMVRMAAKTMASIHREGHDYHAVKFNISPNPKVVDVVSLRLFGSRHVKTGVFSLVQTPDAVLDEEGSWEYFEMYMKTKSVSPERFMTAYGHVTEEIPLEGPSRPLRAL